MAHEHEEHGLDAPEALRSVDLRVTRQRIAVLESVVANPHASTDAIIALVRDQVPGASHQAVYDALAILTERGLLRRVQPRGSVVRYELHEQDPHHHVVCRICGRIEDVEPSSSDRDLTASDTHGFAIERAEVMYWGLCPGCRADADVAPNAP